LWPWLLAASLLWVPGEYILGYIFGANNQIPSPLPNYPIPIVIFVFTVVAAFANDIQHVKTSSLMKEEPTARRISP